MVHFKLGQFDLGRKVLLLRRANKIMQAKQCDQKKSPNVYKSCPRMIFLEKLKILTPSQKLPKNV